MSQISKGKVLDPGELFYDSDTGKLLEVRADWTTEASCGDQIGYIDWPACYNESDLPVALTTLEAAAFPGHNYRLVQGTDQHMRNGWIAKPLPPRAMMLPPLHPSRSAYVRACGHRPLAETRVSASVTNESRIILCCKST